jgi:biotin synthase-like enzyme
VLAVEQSSGVEQAAVDNRWRIYSYVKAVESARKLIASRAYRLCKVAQWAGDRSAVGQYFELVRQVRSARSKCRGFDLCR